MQPYIFTLLCLASLASLVAFDAANARKYSAYAQTIENHENFLTVRRAACAEVEYQEKLKKLAPIQKLPKDKETSTPNKVAQVATRKKQRYRLLKVPFSRPPNNSRYNLYALLTEPPEEYNNPSSWYAIFVRLLKRAYVDPGIVPQGAEYAITNLLLNHIICETLLIAPVSDELTVLHMSLHILLTELYTSELCEDTVTDEA